MGSEVLKDPGQEAHGVQKGQLIGEGDKGGGGGDVLEGILVPGQQALVDQGPEAGDVIEIFDVHLKPLEGFELFSPLGQFLSNLPALLSGFNQVVGMEDSVDGGGGQVNPVLPF